MKGIFDLILVVAIIMVHELGHYIDAKRQKIFKGVFLTGLTVGVSMTDYFKYRWNYLGGIIYSFLLYPICLWMVSAGLIIYKWVWLFPAFAFMLGIVDFLVFLTFNKNWKNQKFLILDRSKSKAYRIVFYFFGGEPENIIWVSRDRKIK